MTAKLRSLLGLCLALAFALALFSWQPRLSAQETAGAVRGEVTDSSDARVADASIELSDASTGAAFRQKSNQEGLFTFNLIPPGTYTIRASLAGFQTYTVTGLRVEINRTTQVNLKLELGNVSEVVEVNASPVAIETASANVNTNVERKLVVELPSTSRNPLAMAALAPGVNLIRSDSQVTNIQGAAANVNGLRLSANVYYMDGSDNTGTFRNTALQFPNPEAVAELQVSTASTSAEFGKQPGGVFNVITKSGTNSLHGAGFYFFRDESLNANTWDRNRSGVERPVEDQNQLGGVLGGPVIKNRTFFFGSFMIYRQKDPGFQNNRQVPTQAMLNGDFSQFTRQLFDPDTGLPLAGNRIPQRLIDPVAKNMSSLFPTVGNLGERLIYDFSNTISNNEALGKIDHNFNEKHQLSASYMRTWGDSDSFTDGNNAIPGWAPMVNNNSQHTVSAKHLWTVNPTSIIQFRFALAKHVADRDNVNQGRNLEDFGAIWPLGSSRSNRYLPIVNISDGFIASPGNLSLFDQNNYRFGGTVSLIRGSHNIKFGLESQRSGVRQFNPSDRASFSFDGRASSRAAGANPAGIGVFGYSMADYLMGRSSSFQQSGTRDYDIRNWSHYSVHSGRVANHPASHS
ncbi:MAG: carboxypeptidase regulatory-like domain-containing protein [Bryobacterales bacterium]|nr:carboxypeptidase regulatory-like domain-containing protein [Bryobacterales bacterium]